MTDTSGIDWEATLADDQAIQQSIASGTATNSASPTVYTNDQLQQLDQLQSLSSGQNTTGSNTTSSLGDNVLNALINAYSPGGNPVAQVSGNGKKVTPNPGYFLSLPWLQISMGIVSILLVGLGVAALALKSNPAAVVARVASRAK